MFNAHQLFHGTPELLKHSYQVMITTRQIIAYLPQGLVSTIQAHDLSFAALYHDLGKTSWPADWHTKPFQELNLPRLKSQDSWLITLCYRFAGSLTKAPQAIPVVPTVQSFRLTTVSNLR
jgi:hypothetical protein